MSKTTQAITYFTDALAANANQIFTVNADTEVADSAADEGGLLVADPANNSRGYTPEIGSKELSAIIADMEEKGQTTPGFATLLPDGRANLYAGFRRLRARQTMAKAANGSDEIVEYKFTITDREITEREQFEYSLSENVFNEPMTIMQKVEALKKLTTSFQPDGSDALSATQAGVKMNMSKASATTYLRFDMFPSITKKALTSGKLSYNAASGFTALLPTAKQIADEPEEEAGMLLAAAQEKITKLTERELAKTGKVTGAAVDKATRKESKAGKKTAANKKQRTSKLILQELAEELAAYKEIESPNKAQTALMEKLAAIKRYVAGGSMKGMVNVLGE